MSDRLKDKIVFITGAAGTIGKTVAQAITREGGIAIGSDLKQAIAQRSSEVTVNVVPHDRLPVEPGRKHVIVRRTF